MSETKQSKKITVALVLSWIFSPLFALTGIISIFSEPIPGIVMLIMATVLLPPINKLVEEKWNFHLSRGIKVIVIIVGFIIFGATVDTSNTANQKEQQLNSKPEQNINNVENQEELIKSVDTPVVGDQNNKQPTESQLNDPITTIPPESEPTPIPEPEPELTPAPTPTPEPVVEEEPEPEPTSSETISQKNAVRKAKDYLDYSAFSHDGLIDQLEYEQFSHSDAVYGADNCDANWNEQAIKKAKTYLDYSAFSHDGLVDQLKYDKFTQAQAKYGADNSAADWNEQATKKAQAYMEYSAFSRGSLIEQLKYDKFTQTQAEYGANAVGL